MAMQFNKPRFDWEVKDHLSELEQFKQECSILFQGPLSEMKDAQKAGLVVNWIGRQCVMTLHSMEIGLAIGLRLCLTVWRKFFVQKVIKHSAHFKFTGLKQKASQSCDSYMSELILSIVECRYPDIVQDELRKDQFIFGLVIKEIQDHLLGEIVAEDSSEKCLLESRKIESKIKQRKLLGIKAVTSYESIQTNRGRGKFRSKSQGRGRSASSIRNCKYCGKSHNRGNCLAYGKKCQKCGKENHFKAVCKSGGSDTRDHSNPRTKKGKSKKFHEINESGDGVMDDLTEKLQSLFYNDVHFNSVNSRMHTTLNCKTA